MPSIPSVLRETYNNQFKCIYVKNQQLFLNVLLNSYNLNKILNILLKNLSLLA